MVLEYKVIRSARICMKDEKALFRVIQELTELNRIAHYEGLIAIDQHPWTGFESACEVFDHGINMATSGCSLELVESVMHNMIFTAFEKRSDLMKTLIIAMGLISIVRNDPSPATALLLLTLMGDEYIRKYDEYRKSDEYKTNLVFIHEVLNIQQ